MQFCSLSSLFYRFSTYSYQQEILYYHVEINIKLIWSERCSLQVFPPSVQGQLQLASFKVSSKFNSRRQSDRLPSLMVSLTFSYSNFCKLVVASFVFLSFSFLFYCSEILIIFCSRVIFYLGFSLIFLILMRTNFKPFFV